MISFTDGATRLIRTDYEDDEAWLRLVDAIGPGFGPISPDWIVDDPAVGEGLDPQAVATLCQALGGHPSPGFVLLADSVSMTQADQPLLVVDLMTAPVRYFRTMAALVEEVSDNLVISNLDFEEWLEWLDDDGIFRGFPWA